MFGLIVKFVMAEPGTRADFIRIVSTGFRQVPGCYSYILAEDPADEVTVWLTEVWDSAESHDAASAIPRVQAAMAEAGQIRLTREMRVVTRPIGGQGL